MSEPQILIMYPRDWKNNAKCFDLITDMYNIFQLLFPNWSNLSRLDVHRLTKLCTIYLLYEVNFDPTNIIRERSKSMFLPICSPIKYFKKFKWQTEVIQTRNKPIAKNIRKKLIGMGMVEGMYDSYIKLLCNYGLIEEYDERYGTLFITYIRNNEDGCLLVETPVSDTFYNSKMIWYNELVAVHYIPRQIDDFDEIDWSD